MLKKIWENYRKLKGMSAEEKKQKDFLSRQTNNYTEIAYFQIVLKVSYVFISVPSS